MKVEVKKGREHIRLRTGGISFESAAAIRRRSPQGLFVPGTFTLRDVSKRGRAFLSTAASASATLTVTLNADNVGPLTVRALVLRVKAKSVVLIPLRDY